MERGFTLIELVVVLVVLAVVTHLAVREVGHIHERRFLQAADRQLEDIRSAALAFLSDTGRLPLVTNGTLSELWIRPSDMSERHLENRGGVYVPVGWDGPYLRLPAGKRELLDPWGNPISMKDAANLPRIGTTNGWQAVSVSHYGPTALVHGRKTLSLAADGGLESRLVVVPVSLRGETTNEVTYAWYGPCGHAAVTQVMARAVSPAPVVFEKLTPGRKILWDSRTGIQREVTVRGGDNRIEIMMP